MRAGSFALLTLAPLAFAACQDSTGPDGFGTEELTTELAVAPQHFHIWETEGTFTASVTDPDGNAVTDFEEIRLECQLAGSTTWGEIELTQDGDVYEGTYTFESSGDYQLRVMGLRESDDELKLLYTAPEVLEVVRAHGSMGGYMVSFESFPGHIHQGDASTLNFWFEAVHATAPAAAGPARHGALATPTILVGPNGSVASYTAQMPEEHHYTATHTFTTIGDVPVAVRFIGEDAQEHTYIVDIEVHAPH